MKFEKRDRKAAVTSTVTIILALFALSPGVLADPAKQRLAIVYTERVRPYETLKNGILQRLGNKLMIRTFALSDKVETRVVEKDLVDFAPAVTVSIGNRSSGFCNVLDIAPVISAYDTRLLDKQNPFCILQHLQPAAKKVTAVVDKNITDRQSDFLVRLAAGYGLDLSVRKTKPERWRELLFDSDAIVFGWGASIINVGSKNGPSRNGPVVAVVDRSIDAYRQLEQHCIQQLPRIDKTIDLHLLKDSRLRRKLTKTAPTAIVCIGANSYRSCRFMQNKCRVSIVLKTKPITGDASRWGNLSGVSMFVEPKAQTEALSLLVKEPLTLAVPYDPENTELLVLKALLDIQNSITLIPLPVSDSSQASKLITRAFHDYDGIWAIPDQSISVTPIRGLLLEESLQRKKILVAMMHPYAKRGAAMSVSSVGREDALLRKVVELINERLSRPGCAGRVVSPPVSISLNVRTIKGLNYEVPASLLERAEFVFGKE